MSSAAFTDRELEQLRNSVYKGYQMKPRNYGQEAMDFREYEEDPTDEYVLPKDEIDFAAYRSGYSTPPEGKPGHDGDVNTSKLWSRVAKNIGIKNVDSENDLRQMFDYVLGMRGREEKEPEVTPPSEPPKDFDTDFQPSPDLQVATDVFNQGKAGTVNSGRPRMNYTDDPYRDAITYGDDTKDYMTNSFFPRMAQEASLASKEMKEADRFFLDNFAAKIPQLGDPKELFDYYAKRIDNA